MVYRCDQCESSMSMNDWNTTDAVPDAPRTSQQVPRPDQNTPKVTIEEVTDEEAGKPKQKTRPKSSTKHRTPKGGRNIVHGNVINVTNSSYVRIGTDMHYNFGVNGPPAKPKTQPAEIPLTQEIEELFSCMDPLTQIHLDFFATHIGERWKDLGRKLQYSDGRLEQFEINNKSYKLKETIYQMLLDWTREFPEIATIASFCKILWRCDIKDVVQRLTLHNFTKL